LFRQDEPSRITPEWNRYFTKQTKYSEPMKAMAKTITMDELIEAKNKLGNNKAPGPDKITYEQIKYISSDRVLKIILFIFNECLNRCIFPTNANKATIILLSKLPAFNGDPNKLRPITLLSTFRKLFTRIINTRLQNIIETNNILKGNNFGFRLGKSTNNYLSSLRNVIDHARQTDNRLYIALLDIQKAYDTVPNEALRLCLNRIAVPTKIIDLIINMQTSRSIQIATPYGSTTPFNPNRGLPQGDVISCLLWNIFYDTPLQRLQNSRLGYQISPTIQITELAVQFEWYLTIRKKLESLDLSVCTLDTYLFFKTFNGGIVLLALHVDDTLMTGTNVALPKKEEEKIMSLFPCKLLGEPLSKLKINTRMNNDGSIFT
jgi:hypothetical protein